MVDVEKVGLDEIAAAETAGGKVSHKTLPEIGLDAFRAILLFSAFMVLLLGVFAWVTYPDMAALERLVATDAVMPTYQQLQAEWFSRLKDLGQLYVLTPLLPLLAVVLGYIFGRRSGQAMEHE
jgi:hypothetical protein